tara:strand:+ start:2119 stop:2655 length:537 start_codon:yes stop_codon:yes gene_type:complete
MEFAKQVSRIVGKSGAEAKAGRESMAKYDTIDEVMEALYDCISGPPGGQDWERDREIYHPRALITRTRIVDGAPVAFTFSYDEFVEATIPILAGRSFYEIEIGRKTDIFGQIAHVFSTYEARETPDHPEIQFRGVNMVHLWNDGFGDDGQPNGRWWIMSIIWDNEREGLNLPGQWLAG